MTKMSVNFYWDNSQVNITWAFKAFVFLAQVHLYLHTIFSQEVFFFLFKVWVVFCFSELLLFFKRRVPKVLFFCLQGVYDRICGASTVQASVLHKFQSFQTHLCQREFYMNIDSCESAFLAVLRLCSFKDSPTLCKQLHNCLFVAVTEWWVERRSVQREC